MGELPTGLNTRDKQLDAYENINKQVAASFKIPYISLREKYLETEPSSEKDKQIWKGKLTVDGEHPNELGSALIKNSFLGQIALWKQMWQENH